MCVGVGTQGSVKDRGEVRERARVATSACAMCELQARTAHFSLLEFKGFLQHFLGWWGRWRDVCAAERFVVVCNLRLTFCKNVPLTFVTNVTAVIIRGVYDDRVGRFYPEAPAAELCCGGLQGNLERLRLRRERQDAEDRAKAAAAAELRQTASSESQGTRVIPPDAPDQATSPVLGQGLPPGELGTVA